MKSINEYLTHFLNIYLSYLEVELYSSMFEDSVVGRNIDALVVFQDTFCLLLTKNLKDNEIQELLENSQDVANAYINEAYDNRVETLKPLNSKDFSILLGDKEFIDLIKEYQVAYKDFLQYLPRLGLSNEVLKQFHINKEGNILVQSILEFNNALAHISNTFYSNDEVKDESGNIKKAKNHIYRAILDNYKMLLRFMIPAIRETMTENLWQNYRKIRIDEFLFLGRNITDKTKNNETMTKRYKEFFNVCLSIQNH